ncbi:cytochrome P450 [Candidatus Binatia bacterium]|nr:cytochrome P450 [Candidatus Binatia bacterium]
MSRHDASPDIPLTFEPTDLEHAADPYALLASVRAGGPVRQLASGYWAVTGHAAALAALRHPRCGTSPIALRYLDGLPPGAARDEMSHRINFLDPPDHPRVRSIVAKAFTPRRIGELRPWIERRAEALLDELRDARDASGEVDVLARFAHQLPSLVISELLGVTVADRGRLTGWSDAVAPLLGVRVPPLVKQHAVAAAEEFHAYLSALLEERRRAPGDDLLSALLVAEEDGQRLARVELLSLAATLYSAGHRTTRDLFANGLSVLLRMPGALGRIAHGEWPVAAVVEEMLRHETPTLFVARVPLEPVTIGEAKVGAFEPLLVFLAAANRDPDAYEVPDEFRPGRNGPGALSFAFGAHFCLGAALARSEAEVMLSAFARRHADATLARSLRWHQRGPFRGLDELVVRLA